MFNIWIFYFFLIIYNNIVYRYYFGHNNQDKISESSYLYLWAHLKMYRKDPVSPSEQSLQWGECVIFIMTESDTSYADIWRVSVVEWLCLRVLSWGEGAWSVEISVKVYPQVDRKDDRQVRCSSADR